PPPRVGARGAGRIDILAGTVLDERRVRGRASGVDTATADADPCGRELGLAGLALRGRGHGPGPRNRLEGLATLLDGALVVSRPVVRLVGADADDPAVMHLRRLRSGRVACRHAEDGDCEQWNHARERYACSHVPENAVGLGITRGLKV